MKSTGKEKKNRPSDGREKIPFERVSREKLIEPTSEDIEGVVEISLRPSKLDEFVGQDRVKENLQITLEAAKKRKEPLEHILQLHGFPSSGLCRLRQHGIRQGQHLPDSIDVTRAPWPLCHQALLKELCQRGVEGLPPEP